MVKEINQPQLNQMLNLVKRLRDGSIGIPQFVSDQWVLLEMLKNVNLNWRKAIYNLISEIEDLYASARDRNVSELSKQELKKIEENLDKLCHLLAAAEDSRS